MTSSHYLTPLEWDSAFLGFPTGRIAGLGLSVSAIEQAVAQARQEGYRLLYIFLRPEEPAVLAAAQRLGATVVDDKQVFVADAGGVAARPANMYPVTSPEVTPELLALTLQSGAYSRFRLDPNFAPDVFERLYTHWIGNTLRNAPIEQVLLYRAGPSTPAVGLLTLERQADNLTMGLLAVDRNSRRQGIGQQFIAAAKWEARAAGYSIVKLTTQGANLAACRLYEQCGFRLVQRQYVLHLWLAPSR